MSKRRPSDEPCIYCGSRAARRGREHVIPQAFGRFEHNWTLTAVCDECNHYFSRELELALARDSAESVLRLQHGLRPPSEASKLGNRRVQMRVAQAGFFEGASVKLEASEDLTELVPVLKQQVGFRVSEIEPWQWVDADNLNTESIAPFLGREVQVRVVGDLRFGPAERLVERLAALGIEVQIQGRYTDPIFDSENSVSIEQEFAVDHTVQRAMAKISFNYAAKALGSEIVRSNAFDRVRQYVRHGELSDGSPVEVGRIPLLVDEEVERRLTRGHLCSVAWSPDMGQLVGQVTLFNELSYRVALATGDIAGLSSRMPSGHLFDPFTRRISEVGFLDLK